MWFKNESFILYSKEKEEKISHFGIAIAKKVGTAVERNKLKRQVRMIMDSEKENFPNYKDYIIMIRKSCKKSSYQQMLVDLRNLIKEIK